MNGAERVAKATEAIKHLKDYIELEKTSARISIADTKKTVIETRNQSRTEAEKLIKELEE